jgi:hypothetical protein
LLVISKVAAVLNTILLRFLRGATVEAFISVLAYLVTTLLALL